MRNHHSHFGGYSVSCLSLTHMCTHTLLHKRSKESHFFFFSLNNLWWNSFCNFLSQILIVGIISVNLSSQYYNSLKWTIFNCCTKHPWIFIFVHWSKKLSRMIGTFYILLRFPQYLPQWQPQLIPWWKCLVRLGYAGGEGEELVTYLLKGPQWPCKISIKERGICRPPYF